MVNVRHTEKAHTHPFLLFITFLISRSWGEGGKKARFHSSSNKSTEPGKRWTGLDVGKQYMECLFCSSSSSSSFASVCVRCFRGFEGQATVKRTNEGGRRGRKGRTRLEPIWSPHEASTKGMDFTGWIRKWRCCELNTKEGEGEVTNSAENESTEKVGKLCRTDGLLCDVVAGPYGASCPSCLWAPTGPWILQYLKNMITYRFLFRACPYLREKTTRLRRTAVMRMLSTTW